jgi:peroxiredoxin
MTYKLLTAGDTAPTFTQKSLTNPNYAFDTVGGRYILLGFFGSTGDDEGQAMWQRVQALRPLFNDDFLVFFGVTCDNRDEKKLTQMLPGIRHFLDFDGMISKLYGSIPVNENVNFKRQWVLLDPMMRVHSQCFNDNPARVAAFFDSLKSLPALDTQVGFEIMAPVLVLPRVFEPEMCKNLMRLYQRHGGETSGFMRQVDGKTVGVHDLSHKSRTDYTLEDEDLKKQLQRRVQARIVPQIEKAYQYKVTRMERYLVACYDHETGGHFRAHRDNTTSGTAHRRFAVSINLNDEFEGGEVGFAEYGSRTFKPPVGGAVVFSCSLLHHVTKVKSGKRFAFLPFLYDEAAAKLREENNAFMADDLQKYKQAA